MANETKRKKLKPIPYKDLPEDGKMAVRASRRAMRKLRAEHKRLGLPLLVMKDGKMIEVQP